MSEYASGAADARLTATLPETYIGLPEQDHFELRELLQAIEAVGHLADVEYEAAPELAPGDLAALFRTFGRFGRHLLSDAKPIFPARPGDDR